MTKQYDVAILGATGMVGQAFLDILAQRNFPIRNLYLLASERSAGEVINFKGQAIKVLNVADFDFAKAQIGLFSAGGNVSAKYAPIAAAKGCIVIDNTSHFRYEKEIPLVVSEVNSHAIAHYKNKNIIANPNCSTMQLMVALKPLYDAVGIKRLNIATYQSVSGTGKEAVQELLTQTQAILQNESVNAQVYPCQIAFNVIPHGGDFLENGYTSEEMKLVWETKKILEDDAIQVNATVVRVPVLIGHSEAVNIETRDKITAIQARELLKKSPGIVVIDEHQGGGYPTAITHAAGNDPVYVGRIREDLSHALGLNLWVVADNVRKGAALNAVQIAEILVRNFEVHGCSV